MAKNANNIENENTENLLKVIEEKDKQLNNLKNELNNVNNKFDSLEKMILDLQNKNQSNSIVQKVEEPKINKNDDIVKIGSCLIGKHYLCDNTGAEVVELEDIGDVASVPTRILDSLMTSRNKPLFRDGLIYFLDESLYDRYSIKKGYVLDQNTLDNIYKMPVNEMVKELNKLTNEGRNERVKYSLYWAIVKNIACGKEGYNDKSKELMLSNYFNVDINNSIGQLSYCQDIGYF